MKLNLPITIFFLLIAFLTPVVSAAEDDGNIELFGFELEKLLSLATGLLATVLFITAFIAYKRDGKKRLLYVSIAFLLFALKGFLVSSELFIPVSDIIDSIAVILEFAAILTFF